MAKVFFSVPVTKWDASISTRITVIDIMVYLSSWTQIMRCNSRHTLTGDITSRRFTDVFLQDQRVLAASIADQLSVLMLIEYP